MIVAHSIWGRGGAEYVAMHIIEALLNDFDVTVYTRGGFDLDELNALAATKVSRHDIRLMVYRDVNLLPGAVNYGLFLRSLALVGRDFDIRISASGIMHWGSPAVHFISSVSWNGPLRRRFSPTQFNLRTWLGRLATSALSDLYLRRLDGDVFVANSLFTARHSQPFCPSPIKVIHPAATVSVEAGKELTKRNAILALGRVSPEKRIEECISIVEAARIFHSDLTLCIAGPSDGGPYGTWIENLCAERASWITRIPLATGAEKAKLLSEFKIGINCCREEAFGIANVEMMAAGLVVIAPRSGAHEEVLSDPACLYSTEADAVSLIRRIIDDDAWRNDIVARAQRHTRRFNRDSFSKGVLTIVSDLLEPRTQSNGQ